MQKARRNGAIVLGLRATAEQRAWLNKRAAERKMSMQSVFDEAMRQYAVDSPWMDHDETLVATPLGAQEATVWLHKIYRASQKNPALWDIANTVLSGLHSLIEKDKEAALT